MNRTIQCLALSGLGLFLTAAGCTDDKPHEYGQMRPPITDLDVRDRGLQSKDVVDASDQVAMDLLSLPQFNGPTRKTVVVTAVENKTQNPYFNYDIFIARLKTNIAKQGPDRIMLIENKARFNNQRSAELDTPQADRFGQTGGTATTTERIQPQYDLYGVVTSLPNRGTDYYHFEFTMTDLKTGEQIPLGWDVRVGK